MKDATIQELVHSFSDVLQVIENEDRFKVKLGIGKDAFTTLKSANLVGKLWDVGGAAGLGVTAATSTTVAGSVFGTFWTSVGIASAATPIGWVVGAALVSGGAYYGVSRVFRGYSESRVDEIPKFLNTPLDVLASSVLDLLGSLALKVAAIDGNIDQREKSSMVEYFVDDWGYDKDYVEHALDLIENNIEKSKLTEMTSALAEFAHSNPDCNFSAIQNEVKLLLTEIAEADGYLDEREEMAIERITNALHEQNSIISSTARTISSAASGTVSAASGAVSAASNAALAVGSLTEKLWTRKS